MDTPLPEFHDPALKSAVRRALGNERAPAALRRRISDALAIRSQPRRWRYQPTIVYPLAAILVLGLGIGAFMLLWRHEPPVPDWFADAMVNAHQSRQPDREPLKNVAANDLPALQKRLRELLGHPVLLAMLGDGWVFNGAAISQINHIPAARLMFQNGDDKISIFSVSANSLYSVETSDGKTYSQTRKGYQVAGFTYGGAIHCLIAESPKKQIALRQIIDLRDKLRAQPEAFGPNPAPLSIPH